MKKILITIGFIISLNAISHSSMAQNILKQADEQYMLFNYTKAAELYLKAYKKDTSLYIAERLANSNRLMRDYPKTELWYATALKMAPNSAEYIYRYAEALRNNAKYAEAKIQYAKYYTLNRDINRIQLKVLTSACDTAIKWLKKPLPVEVTNERSLNTPRADIGATIYNGKIVFSSDRKKVVDPKSDKRPFLRFDSDRLPDPEQYGWTGRNYLRLYWSAMTDTVTLFPFAAGTDYHVGPATFTADGNEVYFTTTRVNKDWDKDTSTIKTFNLEIFTSKKSATTGAWSKPVPFKYNNAAKWSAGDPFITPDGKKLYYVSDMPGGLGGTDIYYSTRNGVGEWTAPINLKALNTPGNERTPYVDSLSNLYFSSDGDLTMGGLDIFKATRKGNAYGPKQNMGYPVNSPRDDFSFVLTGPETGYLSSDRAGGLGSDDIYKFVINPVLMHKLEGVVLDKITLKPVGGSTVVLGSNRVVTDETGKFSFMLSGGSDYKLRVEKDGYLSDNQDITTKGLKPLQTVKKDLFLQKIILNKAIRLENIYYDFDSANIRPESAVELDKLVKVLRENPEIVIELGSHTDSKG
ncbi:MAG: flagellar motor protein MotB, partial [Sphingobacteriaceae bacterium]